MEKNNVPKVQTVVQGEASESEEEEVREVGQHNSSVKIKRVQPFPSRLLPSKHSFPAHGHGGGRANQVTGGQAVVVVAGEASESDEEEMDTSISEAASSELLPLKVEQNKTPEHGSSSDLSDIPMLMSPRMAESRFNKPKYDTLLHRKLRESNWQLYEHMVEVASQSYSGAARSLNTTITQLVKSHNVVQDISHSMRLLTNDLFHLDDRINIIQSCKLLPDINISVPLPVPEAASSQPA